MCHLCHLCSVRALLSIATVWVPFFPPPTSLSCFSSLPLSLPSFLFPILSNFLFILPVLCSPSWLGTPEPPNSASYVLSLLVCPTLPDLRSHSCIFPMDNSRTCSFPPFLVAASLPPPQPLFYYCIFRFCLQHAAHSCLSPTCSLGLRVSAPSSQMLNTVFCCPRHCSSFC